MAPFNLTILAMSSTLTEGTKPLRVLLGVSTAQSLGTTRWAQKPVVHGVKEGAPINGQQING